MISNYFSGIFALVFKKGKYISSSLFYDDDVQNYKNNFIFVKYCIFQSE